MPSQTPSDSAERTRRSSISKSSTSKSKRTARKAPPAKTPSSRKKKAKAKRRPSPEISLDASPPLDEFEERIGCRFSDPNLLLQALTHRSYAQEITPPEEDNERLEFLGDAVLQLIVTKRLWTELAGEDEGVLTRRRSERVSGRALARVAREMELQVWLRLGKGELKTGGRQKPSILADALEALVGAIYLDAGYARCAEVVESWLWREEGGPAGDMAGKDYKSELQERLQKKGGPLPVYRVMDESGPEHDKTFRIDVRHGKRVLGKGEGRNKKEAEQAAARESLAIIEKRKSPARKKK